MTTAKLDHYLAGLEGLALSRHWLIGDRAEAERRFEALRALVQGEGGARSAIEFEGPRLDADEGYARWASTYDAFPNPLIAVEQEPVQRLIDASAPGRALDAACGSGRHTAYLVARGHRVCAVDASPAMLKHAAERAPEAELHEGSLLALPIADASVDLAVCALALTHCADLGRPLAELARVLRPGGRLIVSDFHPVLGLLGNTALFIDASGRPAFVASHVHLHADYLAAYQAAGLRVRACLEPRYEDAHLATIAAPLPPQARDAIAGALLGLPAALIWELEREA